MKRIAAIFAVMALAAFLAIAQSERTTKATAQLDPAICPFPDESGVAQSQGERKPEQTMMCPMMSMMQSTMPKGMDPEKMKQMMGQMEMTPQMMERMQVLMRTPIFLDSPCPLYAQADKLSLSEDQKKKLGEIENEARQKARAVLTPEQQAKLGNVPDKPVTMMEMCPMMKSGAK